MTKRMDYGMAAMHWDGIARWVLKINGSELNCFATTVYVVHVLVF